MDPVYTFPTRKTTRIISGCNGIYFFKDYFLLGYEFIFGFFLDDNMYADKTISLNTMISVSMVNVEWNFVGNEEDNRNVRLYRRIQVYTINSTLLFCRICHCVKY